MTPRKRPRQERSRATVDRIVDAAARLFDERGYRSTTTNHVADEAGVSVGSLYQYFPNKDALLAELAVRHLDEAEPALLELADELRASAPSAAELAEAIVGASADLNPTPLYLLLRDAPRNAAIQARVEQLEAMATAFLADELRRLGHPEATVEHRARLAFLLVEAVAHDPVVAEPLGRAEAVRAVGGILALGV